MKDINLKGVSNIVNSTQDLEWFMTQFIRKYAEMAEMQDLDCSDTEIEDLKIDLQIANNELGVTQKHLEELQVKYDKLRDMYLELYVMYIQAKNKGKIDKSMKDKHREYRKELEQDKLLDFELPF